MQFQMMNWKLNLIILHEIWSKPDIAKLIIIEEYSRVKDARQRRIGDGVAYTYACTLI